MLLVLFLAAACANPDAPSRVGYTDGFYGGAVADEPRAVLVARDVLASGGSAADAAVALYFALAVTKPADAGLGAVGMCLLYEPAKGEVQALDFTPSAGGASVAVPGAVRGMAALHAIGGRFHWSQVVAPAEELARFGVRASRSFIRDLARRPEVTADSSFGATVTRPDGAIVGEGDRVIQTDLAGFIAAIRMKGAAAFYSGDLGRAFAEAVAAMGERLDFDDMRAAAPTLTEALAVPAGNSEAHFMPSSGSAGPYQARLWDGLAQGDRAASETATIQFTESGTSFVVADKAGNAVSCGVTLNRPFGIGRTAPGTGIFPAALPEPGRTSGALSPLIVANPNTDILVFAGSASGSSAPATLVDMGGRTVLEDVPLDRAIAGTRVPRLAATGFVGAVSCPGGLPDQPESCTIIAGGESGAAARVLPGRPGQ